MVEKTKDIFINTAAAAEHQNFNLVSLLYETSISRGLNCNDNPLNR